MRQVVFSQRLLERHANIVAAPVRGSPAHLNGAAEVFVKLRHPGQFREALACAELKRELGLLSPQLAVVPNVRLTLPYADWAGKSAKAARSATSALLRRSGGVVDVLVMECVRGVTLAEALRPRSGVRVDSLDLLRVLLFRRFLRMSHTSASRLLVRFTDGRVLSLDSPVVAADASHALGPSVFSDGGSGGLSPSNLDQLRRAAVMNERQLLEFVGSLVEAMTLAASEHSPLAVDTEWLREIIQRQSVAHCFAPASAPSPRRRPARCRM